jgi:hypothetical protein
MSPSNVFFFSRQMAQICSLSSDLSHFVKQHADSRIRNIQRSIDKNECEFSSFRVVRLYSDENEFYPYTCHSVNSSIVNCWCGGLLEERSY